MNINFDARRPGKGPLAKLLALLGAVLALIAALMFSLVFFAVAAVAVLGLWGYFWWTTRALRRQMRAQLDAAQARAGAADSTMGAAAPGPDADPGGEIIEGEAVRVVDEGRRLEP